MLFRYIMDPYLYTGLTGDLINVALALIVFQFILFLKFLHPGGPNA